MAINVPKGISPMTSSHAPLHQCSKSAFLALAASVVVASPTLAAERLETEAHIGSEPAAISLSTVTDLVETLPTEEVVDAAHQTSETTSGRTQPESDAIVAESPDLNADRVVEVQEEVQTSEELPKIVADTSPEPEDIGEEAAEAANYEAAVEPKSDAEAVSGVPEEVTEEPDTGAEDSEGTSPETIAEESEAAEEKETGPSPEELARQQMLIEADAMFTAGQVEAAEALYREAKGAFSGEAAESRAEAFSNPEQLSPGGKVYWRESAAGLEKNLKTRTLVPAQLMVEKYPEFVPGHLRYAKALRQYKQLEEGLAVLERAATRYPNQPELQKELMKFQVESKQWLEASITARQFALLNPDHPQAEEFNILAEQYQTKFRKVLRSRITSNAIAGVFTGALNVALTGNPLNAIPTVQSSVLLLRGEDAVGRSAAKRAKKRLEIIDDPEVQAYVDRIGQKLVAVAGREMDYEFNVIKDEKLNAFALPGGKIFINGGAITKSKSEAELAGLMAHELSHSVLSHGFQLVTDGTATTGLTSLLPFGSLFSGLALTDYSRDMERQADLLGTRMLSSAGYAADGLRNLMVTLGKEKTKGPKPPAWLSTHPGNKKRVSYLEELIETNGYNRYTYEGVAEHLKIQERVQAILNAPEEERKQKTLDDEIKDLKQQQETNTQESSDVHESDVHEAEATP